MIFLEQENEKTIYEVLHSMKPFELQNFFCTMTQDQFDCDHCIFKRYRRGKRPCILSFLEMTMDDYLNRKELEYD